MRFALLGIDDFTLPLARAIQASEGHELSLILAEGVDERLPGAAVRAADEWELLLGGGEQDAVLVAACRDISPLGKPDSREQLRLEQVRRLAQAGVPMLVSHPITFNVLDAYEIEMLAAEQGTVVMPILPQRAMMGELLQTCRTLRGINHVSLERRLGPLSLVEALRLFAHDVDLLSELSGGVTKISAMGSWTERGAEPAPLSGASELRGLGAQLSGPAAARCQWSPQSPPPQAPLSQPSSQAPSPLSGCEMVVGSESGQVHFSCDEQGRYELHGGESSRQEHVSAQAAADVLLGQFVAAVAADAAGQTAAAEAGPRWTAAIRSLELTEGLVRSLRRDRTIEIRDDTASEVGAFKGTMASLGCGLLIGGLVLMVLTAVVAGVADRFGFP
ncbi:MAG: hypothetical protein WEA31_10035, partial [Pirellulales bacterium]